MDRWNVFKFTTILVMYITSLSGCLNGSSNSIAVSTESEGIIAPVGMNALKSTVYPQNNLLFFKLDMTPITDINTENEIMACTSAMEFCRSTCVSIYFPEVERYSIFETDWLPGNKCVKYALQYPDGVNIPKMLYYEGTYSAGNCVVNLNAPDFDGRAYVDEVRVPQGQATTHPQGKRLYEVQSWFDLSSNPFSSVLIYNFRPPSSWDYVDTSFSGGYITPQLEAGFSCIRRDQIQ